MCRLKNFICVSLSCLFCLLLGVGVKAANVSRLSALKGERTYFLDSASSQGLSKTELSFAELGRVKGECVQFDLQAYEGGRYATNEEIVQSLLRKFQAKTRFVEEVNGTVSYYAYTPLWQDGLILRGERVNLHIAISSSYCVVGTPVIFGGY